MSTLPNNQPNLKIDSVYAFIAESDEGEGIMAGSMFLEGREMMMPLIGADYNRIFSLYPLAKQISQASGRPFKICKFDNKTDITGEIEVNLNRN